MRCRIYLLLLLGFAACSKPTETSPNEDASSKVQEVPNDVKTALQRNTCLACHKQDRKLIGPSYTDIAQRMTSAEEIISLIRNPNPSHWPDYPAMAGISINDADGKVIGNWILGLKTDATN